MNRQTWSPVISLVVMGLGARPSPTQFIELWSPGKDDNQFQGDFQIKDHRSNDPPGNPSRLDDDYYFAGVYPDPLGIVLQDEPMRDPRGSEINSPSLDPPLVRLERAFSIDDNNKRFHVNFPTDLDSGDRFLFATSPHALVS